MVFGGIHMKAISQRVRKQTIVYNKFENYTFIIASIYPRDQCIVFQNDITF